MIAVINYGAGNLRSVVNAISRLGYEATITSRPDDVLSAQAVILPGVGASSDTVTSLRNYGLVDPIRQYIAYGRPFLGVCIGLQVLFSQSEEGGWHECLDIISGKVSRLPAGLKVPHMGWNQVIQKLPHPVFNDVPDKSSFYFVHSYYVQPDDRSIVAGETEYGIPICSVIAKDNLIATQFHPEKSGEVGIKIYDNFIRNALGNTSNP